MLKQPVTKASRKLTEIRYKKVFFSYIMLCSKSRNMSIPGRPMKSLKHNNNLLRRRYFGLRKPIKGESIYRTKVVLMYYSETTCNFKFYIAYFEVALYNFISQYQECH